MTRPDYQLDQLRDSEGRSFGRPPIQSWLKPIKLEFHTPTLREMILTGKRPIQDRGGPADMHFTLHTPWTAPLPPAGHVKPSSTTFDEFLNLDKAPDTKLYEFAARFGPLMIFCFAEAQADRKTEVIHERSEVWRYFARCMRALLHMAARFHAGQRFNSADWDMIGNCPFPVWAALGRIKDETVLNPLLFQPEEGWSAMTYFIKSGEHRDRKAWISALNGLLQLGRARPFVIWGDAAHTSRPRLVFGAPRLLSYLALQLSLAALKVGTFATCSFCSHHYPTERAPKAGQRNYCQDCREKGVPALIAQRNRRNRLREIRATLRSPLVV